MELLSVRTRVLEQMDWQPNASAAFVAKVNRFVNRAYQYLYENAPFLLEASVKLVTQQDVVSVVGVTSDRIRVHPTDPYVMERLLPVASGGANWLFDGTWDGRWVDIVDNNGVVRRHQTREWWTVAQTADRFSLVHPWQATGTAMEYRVYTRDYSMAGDVVSVKNASLYSDANYRLHVATQGYMEEVQMIDYRGRESGMPRVIYPGEPFQMLNPTRTPTVAIPAGGSTWQGPDEAGQFDFCYTYSWGYKDILSTSPQNIVEPKWESAPSPVSAKITTTNGGAAIVISGLPDIDFELGFNTPAAVRAGRSGLKKRVYARRYTSDTGGGISNPIESPAVFMLLVELGGDMTSYTYTGQIYHDYLRRLKPVHSHNSVRIYPSPDGRYEVDMRVQLRPLELVNDFDVPRIPEDTMELLIQKTLVFMYEYDGKPDLAQLADVRFKEMLRTVTKRYSGMHYEKMTKRLARVDQSIAGLRSRAVTFTGIS